MGGGTKEHAEKIRKSNFNRQRADTDTLRANCGGQGYVFGSDSAKGQCEFHHVLPISSVQDGVILGGKDATALDYIKKCMAATTWDINEQPNLLGLPTKGPYESADRETAKGRTLAELKALSPANSDFGALPDLPCHLNDHDKFTQAVIDRFNQEIWPRVLKRGKQCDNKARSLRATLRAESDHWKGFLKGRGTEQGGAADCWVNRHSKASVWYIPLSMAPVPTKTDPPPNLNQRGGTIADWLENIFNWSG